LDIQRLEGLARKLVPSALKQTSGQRRYLDFCESGNLSPFPLSEDQLYTYVAPLYDEGLLHGTIKGYLSAICHLQIIQGFHVIVASVRVCLAGSEISSSQTPGNQAKERAPSDNGIINKLRDFWRSEGSRVMTPLCCGPPVVCAFMAFYILGRSRWHPWQS
jgi:hypothetical protein